jgi:tetratricopeptide (TPR) repeat protein
MLEASLCSALGYHLSKIGDLQGARPHYERALAINEKIRGSEHLDTASSLNNFGGLLVSQGDLWGARPYYERALAIKEKVLGSEHPNTASSLNNLGFLLYSQGDLRGARPYYERALAIQEKIRWMNSEASCVFPIPPSPEAAAISTSPTAEVSPARS